MGMVLLGLSDGIFTNGYQRPDRSSQGWGALLETHVCYLEIARVFRGVTLPK